MPPRKGHLENIRAAYEAVKSKCDHDYLAESTATAIYHLVKISFDFLTSECQQVGLVSRVTGKEYFSFCQKDNPRIVSRPANRRYWIDSDAVINQWNAWLNGRLGQELSSRISYTAALAPCLAMELFDRQNKKGPATYFECFIGHIFARAIGVNPRKKASLNIAGRTVRLTMDFLFEPANGVKVHLPVKMSTRERVVQAWAHQRILDGAFGQNIYKGIMVLFSETKLDSRSHEVVEICVPDQWLAYQTLLSKIERIYYFDIPARYQALAISHPSLIQIKQFGEFFTEKAAIFRPQTASQ